MKWKHFLFKYGVPSVFSKVAISSKIFFEFFFVVIASWRIEEVLKDQRFPTKNIPVCFAPLCDLIRYQKRNLPIKGKEEERNRQVSQSTVKISKGSSHRKNNLTNPVLAQHFLAMLMKSFPLQLQIPSTLTTRYRFPILPLTSKVTGFLCKKDGPNVGSLMITEINGEEVLPPQLIWGTPKGTSHFPL